MGPADAGAGPDHDGEALRAVARLVAPFARGNEVPSLSGAIVRRRGVAEKLEAGASAPCILVAAPAGYGKTTALITLATDDSRPSAWISIEAAHNDPTVLATHLLLSLDEIAPIPDGMFARAMPAGSDFDTVVISRVAALFGSLPRSSLLVLDDAHLLEAPASLALLRAMVEHCPEGSQVAIGTRDASGLKLGRVRAGRQLVDVGVRDLTMSSREGQAALTAAGLSLDADLAAEIVDRAEGWPAGIQLSALAIRDGGADAVLAVHRGDRLVAEYLRDEILAAETPEMEEFMLRTSILERLSASLCDAVLERNDSSRALDHLAQTNYFVTSLDDRGEWYRYHHLFGELVHADLTRRHAESLPSLHRRASLWFEAHGDVDGAVRHAHGAGDRARVAALAWQNVPFHLSTGRNATVRRWLSPFDNADIAAVPGLALTKAWLGVMGEGNEEVEAWVGHAERAAAPDELLSDGNSVRAAVALLRGVSARRGIASAHADAALAYELYDVTSPLRPVAGLVEAGTARLLGDTEHAEARLEETVATAEILMPGTAVHARGFLAILAVDAQRWSVAERIVARALSDAHEYQMEERPTVAHLYAVAALLSARAGSLTDAREHGKRAVWLMSLLGRESLWIGIEARILLARAELALGDVAEAQHLLREARVLLDGYPDPGLLPEKLSAAEGLITGEVAPVGFAASPLTGAELRILRYLPTHLSFADIADELFVSRNTVKTQAIAVYRKLGVSSRGEAVTRAREMGLLDV